MQSMEIAKPESTLTFCLRSRDTRVVADDTDEWEMWISLPTEPKHEGECPMADDPEMHADLQRRGFAPAERHGGWYRRAPYCELEGTLYWLMLCGAVFSSDAAQVTSSRRRLTFPVEQTLTEASAIGWPSERATAFKLGKEWRYIVYEDDWASTIERAIELTKQGR